MLSPTDYNYIKLLYDRFLKMNEYIAKLIKDNEWDGINFALQDKESLMKQILTFEKTHLDDIKENTELLKTRMHLIELEKKNIELIKVLKEDLSKEIKNVSSSKKILHTYEPSVKKTVSTFEVTDIEA